MKQTERIPDGLFRAFQTKLGAFLSSARKRGYDLGTVCSLAVAVLVTAVSLTGLIKPSVIYPSRTLLEAFFQNDAINLFVGLPLLLGSMFFARRGSLAALLCRPGVLFYFLYGAVLYVTGLPLGVQFLPCLFMIPLTVIAGTAVFAGMDVGALRARFSRGVPVTASGWILIGIAVFVLLREFVFVISALIDLRDVSMQEQALRIADGSIIVPVLAAVGILLVRKNPSAYAFGPGLLLSYGLISLGHIPVLAFQPDLTGLPVDTAGIVAVSVMAAACLVPFGYFMRASTKRVRGNAAGEKP